MHYIGLLIARIIVAITFMVDVYVYHYDFFNGSSCQWRDPNSDIKLLAFGDPQITGSHPGMSLRKKLDIVGNDYYLGHIYEVMTRTKKPSHIAVMGDLFSSQWIDDAEFSKRVERYRERIFIDPHVNIYNISGNHDIGYGGDLTHERLERFQRDFGQVNFVQEFHANEEAPVISTPEDSQNEPRTVKSFYESIQKVLAPFSYGQHVDQDRGDWRIVVLNSMSLDDKQLNPEFQQDTLKFLKSLQPYKGATVLLLHVPLYKEEGHCADGPYFTFYDWGGLKEQNQLTKETSDYILNSVFGPGNPYGGVMLTGHDHRGCDTIYEYESDTNEWINRVVPSGEDYPQNHVRELVVRSMMGEYGGYTGLLTGSYNASSQRWWFDYNQCPFAVQHIWWVSKVLTYISAVLLFVI